MKTHILDQTIAALLLALPIARADDQKPAEKKDATKQGATSSSSTVITSSDGTATVTIDINGKKETRTFKLGDRDTTLRWNPAGRGVRDLSLISGGLLHAKAERGTWLGIGMDPVQEVVRAQLPLAPGEGVVISHVMSDSPAQKAGLAENDILVRFDEQIIVEPAQVRKLIAMKKNGDAVKLIYLRKGERREASATLGEHEIEVGEMNPARWFQNAQGLWSVPPGKVNEGLEHLQNQLKHLKDTLPGVIVDKQSWFSGAPADAIKEQIEKLQRSLEDAKLPKEEIEKLRKELDKAKREASEAMERAKRGASEAMERARRAMEDAAKAFQEARKAHEKDQPKKPGEPQ